MEIQQRVLNDIAGRLVEAEVTDRHVQREYSLYTDIYNVDEENPEADLQTLFDLAIQNRNQPLSPELCRNLSRQFDPDEFLECSSRLEAFTYLDEMEEIGPKIADEVLRKAVHVFGIKSDWEPDLCVPLDTNVVQALVKTEAIDLEGEDWKTDLDGNYQNVVYMRPSRNANPSKRVAYYDIQDGFAEAAARHELPRIVFDELWVEHSKFISNPLLQSESCLYELIPRDFRFYDAE